MPGCLELEAGLLEVLPMAGNPLQREWFVMHLASRQLPQVALAFEQFLVERGQPHIEAQLRFPSRFPARAPVPHKMRAAVRSTKMPE